MSEQAIINPQSTGNMRWYVIHAYSGMEKSVQKGLTERIARSGMADKFGKILVKAFAAPVVVGTIDCEAPRALLKSLWG